MGLLRVEAAARAAADADVACAELLPPAHGVRSPAAGHGADEEEDPPEADEPSADAGDHAPNHEQDERAEEAAEERPDGEIPARRVEDGPGEELDHAVQNHHD